MSNEPSSGLAQRSVGLRGDWIASITNVAPTAATTLTMAALIGASGLASPLALLVAGAAMLCCAVAYHRLNTWQASAAAPVEWVARGLSPIIGFAVGILVLMTALTSNIGNFTLIGSTVLSLIAPGETNNKPLTWVVATLICLLVVAIAIIGVKVTIRFEGWVILVEYMIIAALAIWGLETELTSHASGITAPSWSWFTTSHSPGGSTGLIAGVVIATFLLGGWDSPIYLGDEQQRQRDPGRSVLISITFCTLWVVFLFICLQGLAPSSAISNNASNVLPFLAGRLGPKVFVDLVALAVIASFATTIQSQIVDGSRILFGMGRDNAIPKRFFGVVDPRTHIPRNNILLVGGLALAGAFLVSYQLGAELLNFGAFIGFMGVNLAAWMRYFVRNSQKTFLNLVLPLFGFMICLWIWLSLRTPAKLAGLTWLSAGLLYGAWKTRGFREKIAFATAEE